MVNQHVNNCSQHVVNALLTLFKHKKNSGLVLTTVVNVSTTGCQHVDNGLSTVNNALTMGCQHVDNGLSTVNNALSMGCQRVDYSCEHIHKIKKIRG